MTTTPHAELPEPAVEDHPMERWGQNVLCDLFTANQVRAYGDARERALLARLGEQQQPVAWMWQHDETGRVGFVDPWQVENGWQAANPRCAIVKPLYTHPPAAQPVAQGEREAFEAWARGQGYQRDELARSTLSLVSGKYHNQNTESAWRAWQAARSAAQGAAQVPAGWQLAMTDRSYDMRAKAIIAFNSCTGDLDDKLQAAWIAALGSSPAPSPAGERTSTEGDA